MNTQHNPMRAVQFALLSLIVAFVAGLLVWFLTPHGLGLSPDSAVYVGTARNVLEGHGFAYQDHNGEQAPMTHYPPLYPFLLASASAESETVVQEARLLNIVLSGLLIMVTAYTTFFLVNSIRVAVLTSVFMMTSYTVVNIYLMAWSEAPFLLLVLVGLVFLIMYHEWRQLRLLLIVSVAFGLATLVRYAGIAFVVAASTYVILIGDHSRRSRLRDALLVAIIGFSPLVVWLIRNSLLAEKAINREIAFHPITWDRLHMGATIIIGWLIPGISNSSPLVAICISIGVLALALVGCRIYLPNSRQCRFATAVKLFTVIYSGFLIISISVVDAHTPLDYRILGPLFVPWLISFTTLMCFLRQRLSHVKFVRLFPVALLLIILVFNLIAISSIGRQSREVGLGYTAEHWQNSDVLKQINDMPAGTMIYSNAPEVIYLYNGRYSRRLPVQYAATSRSPNRNYPREMARLQTLLESEEVVLVYFDRVKRDYLPTRQELERELAIELDMVDEDAAILDIVRSR